MVPEHDLHVLVGRDLYPPRVVARVLHRVDVNHLPVPFGAQRPGILNESAGKRIARAVCVCVCVWCECAGIVVVWVRAVAHRLFLKSRPASLSAMIWKLGVGFDVAVWVSLHNPRWLGPFVMPRERVAR